MADFPYLEITAWTILACCVIASAVGTIVPGLPGALFIVVGVIIHKLLLPEVFSGWTVALEISLAIIAWGVDFLATVLGAKLGGASRHGLLGAAIGGIVGMFFMPIGLIAGPFFGAIVGEIIAKRKEWSRILRSGMGAGLGFFISLILRIILLVVMLSALVVDYLF